MVPEDFVVISLLGRIQEMKDDIFDSPPKSYEEFRERLGAFREAKYMLTELQAALRGEENDEDD